MNTAFRTIFLLLALTFFIPDLYAEDFEVEDPNLYAAPAEIDKTLRSQLAEDYLQDCSYIGKEVDLDQDGKATDFIATTADGCAAGNSAAPIFAVRNDNGSYELILKTGGYLLSVEAKKHHGLQDLKVSGGSAGHDSETIWSYNGKAYEKNY